MWDLNFKLQICQNKWLRIRDSFPQVAQTIILCIGRSIHLLILSRSVDSLHVNTEAKGGCAEANEGFSDGHGWGTYGKHGDGFILKTNKFRLIEELVLSSI